MASTFRPKYVVQEYVTLWGRLGWVFKCTNVIGSAACEPWSKLRIYSLPCNEDPAKPLYSPLIRSFDHGPGDVVLSFGKSHDGLTKSLAAQDKALLYLRNRTLQPLFEIANVLK